MDTQEGRDGIATLSLPGRVAVAAGVVVVAVAVAVHLAMVFLHVAPENTLSKRYGTAVDDYVYPEFEQNWKLFAPNPLQQNIAVHARARVRLPDGTKDITGWVDLSAQDGRRIRGNPFPSHVSQNELRRAWDFYTGSHDGRTSPTGCAVRCPAVREAHRDGPVRDASGRRARGGRPGPLGDHAGGRAALEQHLLRRLHAVPGAAVVAGDRRRRTGEQRQVNEHIQHTGHAEDVEHVEGTQATPYRETRLELMIGRGVRRVTSAALGPYQSAVVRIGFAGTWLLFLLREWPHRRELYGPDGPWSWELGRRLVASNHSFTVLLWNDSAAWFEAGYALAVLSAAALALGWRTRLSSVLFMVGVLSLQNRSVFMGDGGDNIIHLMAIYLVFTRCAQVWSLDARHAARRRGTGRDVPGVVLWSLAGAALAVVSVAGDLTAGWALVYWGLWGVQGLWWAVGASRRASRARSWTSSGTSCTTGRCW